MSFYLLRAIIESPERRIALVCKSDASTPGNGRGKKYIRLDTSVLPEFTEIEEPEARKFLVNEVTRGRGIDPPARAFQALKDVADWLAENETKGSAPADKIVASGDTLDAAVKKAIEEVETVKLSI